MPAPGEARPGPWGFWPTVGLSLVIMIGWMLAQVPVVVAFTIPAVTQNRDLDIEAFVEGLLHNGLFWSLAICVAAPVTIFLTLVCAAARKGIGVRNYLALRWPGGGTIAVWCLIQLAFIACVDGLIYLLRGRIVPPFMVDVYETASCCGLPSFSWPRSRKSCSSGDSSFAGSSGRASVRPARSSCPR